MQYWTLSEQADEPKPRIANAHVLRCVYQVFRDEGYGQLLICTPAEFLGGDDDKEFYT